jgi:hypothetical protein
MPPRRASIFSLASCSVALLKLSVTRRCCSALVCSSFRRLLLMVVRVAVCAWRIAAHTRAAPPTPATIGFTLPDWAAYQSQATLSHDITPPRHAAPSLSPDTRAARSSTPAGC